MRGAWVWAAFVVVLCVAGFVGSSWRTNQIDRCEDRGGQAITSPIWTDDWLSVRCIEARRP